MKIFPNEELAQKAYFKNFKEVQDFYDFSIKNFEEFWEKQAHENLTFFENFTEVLDEKDYPKVSWFKNGKINICFEAVDKQAEKNPDKIAIIFVGEPGDEEKVTYKELQKKVCKSANLLKNIGVKKGDKVVFYMPQILETIYLMLACLRIGAIHSIVFGGFSAASLQDRIEDLEADFLITADGAFRKGKPYLLKNIADEALINSKYKVKKTLIVRRNFEKINISENDVIYNEEIDKQSEICDFEKIDSEDISFILYTSGSTGKPKGIIHSTTGYALWTKLTTKWVFDLHKDDIFFSTADIGWITGHSYTVYGPLLNGSTTLIYEGNPLYPSVDRIWEIIEKYRVSKFYTAPTLIRLLRKTGEKLQKKFDLSSLEVLGSVGEPIDTESWDWYFDEVGGKKASIVDTYWQTETGGHVLAPFPFATPMKKKSASLPLPGIVGEIVNKNGERVKTGENGFLVISKPWPAMMRGIWKDEKKFKDAYFSNIFRNGKALYFTGDGAYYDEENYVFITGRIDDIVNISGHKIGISEVEDVIATDECIAECAVVGVSDEITGEALVGFLVLKGKDSKNEEDIISRLNSDLRKEIGPIVSLKKIVLVRELPKTRSGKIVRRALRSIAKGENVIGDLSTIENKDIIEEIKKNYVV